MELLALELSGLWQANTRVTHVQVATLARANSRLLTPVETVSTLRRTTGTAIFVLRAKNAMDLVLRLLIVALENIPLQETSLVSRVPKATTALQPLLNR